MGNRLPDSVALPGLFSLLLLFPPASQLLQNDVKFKCMKEMDAELVYSRITDLLGR